MLEFWDRFVHHVLVKNATNYITTIDVIVREMFKLIIIREQGLKGSRVNRVEMSSYLDRLTLCNVTHIMAHGVCKQGVSSGMTVTWNFRLHPGYTQAALHV